MACNDRNPLSEYTEENLRVLSGVEHIRLRPGMYVGSQDSRGLLYILSAIVAESFETTASAIRVVLSVDGSVEVAAERYEPLHGALSVDDAFQTFLAPGTGGHAWETAFANALSEWFEVELVHRGRLYRQEFERGEPACPPRAIDREIEATVRIAFRPDPEIFGDSRFDANAIREFLRANAMAYSGIRLTLADNRTGTEEVFEYVDGIRACVEMLNASRTPLHPDVIVIRGEVEGVRYEVGLQWCEEDECVTQSHVNKWSLSQGGTHVGGCMNGVRRVFRKLDAAHIPRPRLQKGDHYRRGLTAAVFVQLAEPMFEGATRSRLNNPEVEGIIARGVSAHLKDYFREHPDVAQRIVRVALR